MFTKLGKKIIEDAMRKQPPKAVHQDEEKDDAFHRFTDDDTDVQYHGGCDSNLTDEQRYEKAMGQLTCVTFVGLFFVTL